MSDEQKKVLDLWAELQRVRRQFADLKEQTEQELHQQRQEFNRIVRNLRAVVEGGEALGTGGTAINSDSLIIEIIRRIKDRGGAGGKNVLDLEFLTKLRGTGEGATFDPELYKELTKKSVDFMSKIMIRIFVRYEEAIERNIQLEAGGDENARRVGELESELRKTREKLTECQVNSNRIFIGILIYCLEPESTPMKIMKNGYKR